MILKKPQVVVKCHYPREASGFCLILWLLSAAPLTITTQKRPQENFYMKMLRSFFYIGRFPFLFGWVGYVHSFVQFFVCILVSLVTSELCILMYSGFLGIFQPLVCQKPIELSNLRWVTALCHLEIHLEACCPEVIVVLGDSFYHREDNIPVQCCLNEIQNMDVQVSKE